MSCPHGYLSAHDCHFRRMQTAIDFDQRRDAHERRLFEPNILDDSPGNFTEKTGPLVQRIDCSGHDNIAPHLNMDLFGARGGFSRKALGDAHRIDLFGSRKNDADLNCGMSKRHHLFSPHFHHRNSMI